MVMSQKEEYKDDVISTGFVLVTEASWVEQKLGVMTPKVASEYWTAKYKSQGSSLTNKACESLSTPGEI